jgi:thiol-disulfide isomerase/thioredoxin
MKRILLIISIFLGLFVISDSKSFQSGSEIDLIYETEKKSEKKVYAIVYVYSAEKSLPTAFQIEMKKQGNKFWAKYQTRDEDVFLIWKIVGAINDDNKGDFWEFIARDGKKPIKNAYLRKAFSLTGNQNYAFARNPDLYQALENLATELKNHPKNTLAEIAWLSLQLDLRKITYEKYAKALKKTLSKKYNINNENLTRAVSRALKSINKEKNAEEIEKKFVLRHPDSDLAAEFLISDLSSSETREDFLRLAKKYFLKFPEHSSRQKILRAFISSYANVGKYEELEKELSAMKNIGSSSWIRVANSTKNDSIKSKYISLALEIQEELIENKNNDLEKNRTFYYSLFDFTAQQRNILARIYLKNAETRLRNKNYQESLKYFEKSYFIFEDNSPSALYLGLAKNYESSGNKKKALEITSASVLNSFENDSILAMNKRFYAGGNYDVFLADLQTKAVKKRRNKIKENLIEGDKFYGMLKNTDGKYFDPEDLKGGASALIFWSSWCGPCQAMTPAIEELEALYLDDEDVKIYVIDVWEESDSEGFDNYLDEIEPQFNILIEKTGMLPQKYGILGLPAILYLDKNGRVRQKVNGFKGMDNFVRNSIDVLETLKKLKEE